jgi:hypothetical protein
LFDSSSLLIMSLASVKLAAPIDHLSYIFMFFILLTIIKLALATLHRVFAFWKSMHWRISCSLTSVFNWA